MASVIEVEDVHKTFRIGFFRKRIEAVRGVSFSVRPGETFGILGPNGAGKTTTIKMILRLIFPSRGAIRVFDDTDHRKAMGRLGYMPENPYVYQYLKPLEFLDLCGRLAGMHRAERVRRAEKMIDKVGLRHAVDRPIGKFSKGMTQRVGLAQALLHDPEVLILDEPMSGLDPIGRKEVRDILIEERRRGKTLVFTSHILTDVEMLCDRVAIIQRGKVTACGALRDLLKPEVRRVEMELEGLEPEVQEELSRMAASAHKGDDGHLVIVLEGSESVQRIVERVLETGGRVCSLTPQKETLEDLFIRNAVLSGD